MARKYAKVLVSINDDPDWWALSTSAQALYFTLLVRPDISHCGVADWRPSKIASRSKHTPLAAIKRAADELSAARFIVIDEDSEEVLIRSFVRNDGVLTDNPKGAGAVLRAIFAIGSRRLRDVVVAEARRLLIEQPELASFQAKNGGSELVRLLCQNPTEGSVVDTRSPIASASDRRPIADAIADTHGDGIADGIDARSTPDPLAPNTSHLEPEHLTTTAPTSARSRRTKISDSFEVTEHMREWALEHTPSVDVDGERQQFIDHHTAKGTTMIDWTRAWYTWMRNQQKWSAGRPAAKAAAAAKQRASRPRGSAFGMNWNPSKPDTGVVPS